MSTRTWTLSEEDQEGLIKGAFEAKEGAYSPYSKFPVGAALLTVDREIIKGASIDNASYGATICAECTVIVKAVSEGIRSFIGLAVVTNVAQPVTPCGICRQVLYEFCALDMPILLVPGDYPQTLVPGQEDKEPYMKGGVKEYTLGELLPHSLGSEQMGLSSTS